MVIMPQLKEKIFQDFMKGVHQLARKVFPRKMESLGMEVFLILEGKPIIILMLQDQNLVVLLQKKI